MTTIRQLSRRLFRQIAGLIEQSLLYLAAGDPARPPPPATWFDAFRREPVAAHECRATADATACAAGAACCCGSCT